MTLTFKQQVHFKPVRHGKKHFAVGAAPQPQQVPVGRVPRISRLMALAIRFDDLLAKGEVRDYAELARLGHVTRARVTQIMNLLNLAPDIQEALLFLPDVHSGHDSVKEWQVRPIASRIAWNEQRHLWAKLPESGPAIPGQRSLAYDCAN